MDAFRTLQKHWENIQKFVFCPLRCKTMVFPGFFAYLANCFGFPARPCTCMLAHAAPRVLEWLRQQPRLKRVKLWSAFSIDESRWREVQSALPGMAIQDRLGDIHP
jgi:hypothetical protein